MHSTKKKTKEDFIESAKKIHCGKYDYSKVEYVNSQTKICIICKKHGEFLQAPYIHLRGSGCQECGNVSAKEKNKMKQETFIKKAKKIHNEKYDYSNVKYENTDTKVEIICPEHGKFLQTPHHHLHGIGCPICGANNISENKLFNILKKIFKDAVSQYSPNFLNENGHKQYIDIYIPSKNIGIEYQGRQHFIPINKFGGEKEFELTKQRDEKKYIKSKENGLKILYFSYERKTPENYIDEIYKNENNLIKKINEL